jgi:two-component system response regulator AlgR
MTRVRVMVVDHREPSRQAARELVASAPGFTWLAQAASAEEALEAAIHLRPDLVLVEADMPGIDGLETRRRLEEAVPGTVVVLLSAEEDLSFETLTPEALRALWKRSRPA